MSKKRTAVRERMNPASMTITIFFPSHRLLSHITNVETTDSGERGMNPVAMTIIISKKNKLSEPGIEAATFCSQVRNATDCAMGSAGKYSNQRCCSFSVLFWTFLCLTHYHTVSHFDALKIYSCGKYCEKKRNCL